MIIGLIVFILIGLGVIGAVSYQIKKDAINKVIAISLELIGSSVVIIGMYFLIKKIIK